MYIDVDYWWSIAFQVIVIACLQHCHTEIVVDAKPEDCHVQLFSCSAVHESIGTKVDWTVRLYHQNMPQS